MITLDEFKKKQLDKCRLIGLDLGSKRIGVSICDEKQLIATPFKTIIRASADGLINEIKNLIDENNIKGIIIGNPLNMDGSLLCVSDKPLHGELKLPGMASDFYKTQVSRHLEIGIKAMESLQNMPLERLHSRKLRSFDETAFL